jgi:hypothetical protein
MFTIAGLLNAPALGIQQHAYNQISQAFCYLLPLFPPAFRICLTAF